MRRRIWITTLVLGVFYIIAWLLRGHWFDPAGRAADLRWFMSQVVFCLLGFLFWGIFFSQFILPLESIRQRFHAVVRLILHMLGLHGPAVFVEEGHVREYAGEEERNGPGLIWMDSASAGVLAYANKITRVIGPGLHFTKWNEKLLGTVNLRTQKQSIGPRRGDNPFAKTPESDSEADQLQFAATKARANETMAHTKDNITIIPNITVIFKIKAQPVSGLAPGSRFGYDPESVRKAVLSKMVNASNRQHTLEWNELPAYIAVDVWREMLGKYYFNELFQPIQFSTDLNPPDQPGVSSAESTTSQRRRSLLHEYIEDISHWLGTQFHILNQAFFAPRADASGSEPTPPPAPSPPNQTDTVLNFIQKVVKLRLTQPLMPEIDRDGRPTGRWFESPEYRQMEERGIEVKTVIISNLQMQQEIEHRLLSDWSKNWLQNAQKRADEIKNYLDHENQRIRHETGVEVGLQMAQRINSSEKRIVSQPTKNHKRARSAMGVVLKALLRSLHENMSRREGLRSEIEHIEEIQRDLHISNLEQDIE